MNNSASVKFTPFIWFIINKLNLDALNAELQLLFRPCNMNECL